ncbi:hypothetical protein [Tenacibaculum sp. C7A-26P2]|uniref:hypothetical protein n=1 Tax=Tenacibaculum sp. C7A-26P2 TaxID=3447504 RepID=UPI003F847468
MDFFTSEIEIIIACFSIVVGFLFSIIMTGKNNKLKAENRTLNIKLKNMRSELADFSKNNLVKSRGKNIQTGTEAAGITMNF